MDRRDSRRTFLSGTIIMSSRLISRFAILTLALLSGSVLRGAEKTPRELLPVSTVAYFEIPQPKKLIDTVVDHPIVEKVKQHPDVQKALESPQYGQFEQVLQVVEAKLGMQWRPGLTALTEGGVFVGFDLPSQHHRRRRDRDDDERDFLRRAGAHAGRGRTHDRCDCGRAFLF